MSKRTIDFRFSPDIQQTCIGFADDRHKTLVREDGSLNYNYNGRNDFSEERQNYTENISPYHVPGDDNHDFMHRLRPRFSHRDSFISRSQDFGDPRVASVTTSEKYENSTLSWSCFAYRDSQTGVRADVISWVMSAEPGFGYAASRVELELHGDRSTAPKVYESAGTSSHYSVEGLRLNGLNQYEFLREGDRRSGVFVVLLEGDIEPETITEGWGRYAWEQCRQYWLNLRPFRRRFRIPEPQVQDMLEACARNILQAREIHDGTAVYQVGPTIYRGLWTVDGHFLLQAAHIMGRQREAFEQGLAALMARIQPNGSIELIPGHFKETGIAIATIVRQCELMNEDARLKELWPTIMRMIDYICGLRARAEQLGPDYPANRLFPPAILDGGIEGPFPDYTTPLWILFGLKKAREAGQRLALPETTAIGDLYDEIMDSFLACAARDIRKTPEGIPYLPMIMEEQEYNRPQSATWALAQAIYPGELLPPDHEYVVNFLRLLDSIDDEQGIPKETGWIHHEAVWAYSSMFYAQVWLYAGHPDKAVDYLYAFANHAAPGRVWREEHTLATSRSSEYCGDMPHNWGSAEFIRLTRNLLVMETNGGLELLAGLPDEWLPGENGDLILDETPTRYGTVSLHLRRVDSAGGPSDDAEYQMEYRRCRGNIEPRFVAVTWNGRRYDQVPGPEADKVTLRLCNDSIVEGDSTDENH